MHNGPKRGSSAKYQVQVTSDGVDWHAVTTPVSNKNTALDLAERLVTPGYKYRAFNRYTRRETQRS